MSKDLTAYGQTKLLVLPSLLAKMIHVQFQLIYKYEGRYKAIPNIPSSVDMISHLSQSESPGKISQVRAGQTDTAGVLARF